MIFHGKVTGYIKGNVLLVLIVFSTGNVWIERERKKKITILYMYAENKMQEYINNQIEKPIYPHPFTHKDWKV